MSLFECTLGGEFRTPDGKINKIHPSEVLQMVGPTIQVIIAITDEFNEYLTANNHPVPKPVPGIALLDTGASLTAVDEAVCHSLGISPTSSINISHAGGNEARLCYPIKIIFPQLSLTLINPNAASVSLLAGKQNHVLLLGRDLMSKMLIIYNGPRGRFEICR